MAKESDYNFGLPDSQRDLLPSFGITRHKGKRPLVGTLILPTITGGIMHFGNGQSRPCKKEKCRWCAQGLDKAWKGWNFFFHFDLQQVMILEHTPAIIKKLQEASKRFGSLSGVRVSLFRNGPRNCSKLFCSYEAEHLYPQDVRPVPNLMECLFRMWGEDDLELTEGMSTADHEISEAMLPDLNKPLNGKPSRILALKKA